MKVGAPIPMFVNLFDGDAAKFVRAYPRDASGALVSGAPFNLAHLGEGRYGLMGGSFPVSLALTVVYVIFTDAGYTTESTTHDRAMDTWLYEDGSFSLGGGIISTPSEISGKFEC